ncbi:hypothetical protein RBH29_15520 [Herbivorax sp. ANBcel31]|uniref:hypothetical protein n=1 Tax=Herbivorax sp. ANBcel31 TaxID=3069754 RepID=UPI0027B797E4|nr:hypothetical protein [Herbivorax sp. ANBcel31]MDQ2087840.1 hypothetical protein [Herbivorax sp. ANBcel31]
MKNRRANKMVVLLIFTMLFFLNGCSDKVDSLELSPSLTEYEKRAEEFFTVYFELADEVDAGETLEEFIDVISRKEDKIELMEELLEKIKKVAPEEKTQDCRRMESRVIDLKELYEYSQKSFDKLSTEEKRDIGLKLRHLRMHLNRWNNGEDTYLW